jgi:hypothetical protein
LEDKEDMTVPFDEGRQVMHVVSRHAAFAVLQGPCCERGVPGDRVRLRERSTMPGTQQCGLLTWAVRSLDVLTGRQRGGRVQRGKRQMFTSEGQLKMPDRLPQRRQVQ